MNTVVVTAQTNTSYSDITTSGSVTTCCPCCGQKQRKVTVTAQWSDPKPKEKPKPIKVKVLPVVRVGKEFKPKLPTGFQAKYFKEGRI